jgi:endonuclease/exonuclease/phosphatase family metal-dependent hydrolase
MSYNPVMQRFLAWLCAMAAGGFLPVAAAETFLLATYNLNNYTDGLLTTRPAKTAASRAKIRESIQALRADVLALQEVGGAGPFEELRQSLQADGLDYPHGELLLGPDTNIMVAVLSKFPIIACRRHTNETYLLMGRRHVVQRGFLEAEFQVNSNYTFTAFIVHLKSRRQAPEADEAEMRHQEALLLREKIDALLNRNPDANLAVLGDLNDVKDSLALRTLLGRNRNKLFDTRPAERNGDTEPATNAAWNAPWITWTHFYGKEDTYSRIDYILLSPGLTKEWVREQTYILSLPNWGVASDHRPIVAGFEAAGK